MFKRFLNLILLLTISSGLMLSCGSSRNEAGDGASEDEEARQQELDEIEALLGITPEEKKANEQKTQAQSKKEDDMLGLLDADAVPVQEQTVTTPKKSPATDKEVKNLKSQLEKKDLLIADLKAQIRNQSEQIYQLESRKQPAAGPIFSSGTVSDVAPGEYQQRYQQSLDLFHSSQYKAARENFQSLLASDANNSLSDNAQYWIGECNYAMRQYKKAIMDFEKVFTFPQSNKNDAAQFKLGLCYERLGDGQKAREEFQRLIDVYPKSEFISRARQHLGSL